MLFECTHCSEMNDENRRFCFQCGEHLGCPNCGFVNEYRAQPEQRSTFFCGGCGSTLSIENKVLEKKDAPQRINTEASSTPQKSGSFSHQHKEPELNTILGFSLIEIEADMMAENLVVDNSDQMSIGSPKHLAQNDLDELFDV